MRGTFLLFMQRLHTATEGPESLGRPRNSLQLTRVWGPTSRIWAKRLPPCLVRSRPATDRRSVDTAHATANSDRWTQVWQWRHPGPWMAKRSPVGRLGLATQGQLMM